MEVIIILVIYSTASLTYQILTLIHITTESALLACVVYLCQSQYNIYTIFVQYFKFMFNTSSFCQVDGSLELYD